MSTKVDGQKHRERFATRTPTESHAARTSVQLSLKTGPKHASIEEPLLPAAFRRPVWPQVGRSRASGRRWGDGLRIKLAPGVGGSGLELSTNGLSVAASRGLEIEDNSVHVELATDPGLEFDGSGEDGRLRAKPNMAKGLQRAADGLEVVVASNEGLEVESGGGLGMARLGAHAYMMPVMCSIYLDKNGRIMGWYVPDSEPPDYRDWYSPWGYPEP